MNNLVSNLAGIASTILIIVGLLFLAFKTLKYGFKAGSLISIFLLICLVSYLVEEPGQVKLIGEMIVSLIRTGGEDIVK